MVATDDTIDLREWVDMLRRRRKTFLVVAGALFVLSLVVALSWPSTYRSVATILIEDQDVPADLVQPAVTTSAVERIESISQQVMTRANLTAIVEKHDMFVEAREEDRLGPALDGMRRRIKVDTVDVDVVDPRSGRAGRTAIAFTISYDDRNAELTQRVTEELATLFLEQNRRSRSDSATETVVFLTAEAELLSDQIGDLEAQLAAFKEQNVTGLPELADMNLRLLDNTERHLVNIDSQIRALEERRHILEGDLAQVTP
ncbi:MAG: lipopolysaccharide biosynthesis protein, partial [Inquilinus sp.]|nr:lipopolysaccharide biosynthesis protein [Inquilinus sp.]